MIDHTLAHTVAIDSLTKDITELQRQIKVLGDIVETLVEIDKGQQKSLHILLQIAENENKLSVEATKEITGFENTIRKS